METPAGEAGIPGVAIALTGTNDFGSVNFSTATAADGSYQFRSLRPGNYSIAEAEPASYLHGKNAVGSLGGITGPLAALPGAFVAIWCGMRGWDKVVQRSVYQPFILIMQLLTLGALSGVSG